MKIKKTISLIMAGLMFSTLLAGCGTQGGQTQQGPTIGDGVFGGQGLGSGSSASGGYDGNWEGGTTGGGSTSGGASGGNYGNYEGGYNGGSTGGSTGNYEQSGNGGSDGVGSGSTGNFTGGSYTPNQGGGSNDYTGGDTSGYEQSGNGGSGGVVSGGSTGSYEGNYSGGSGSSGASGDYEQSGNGGSDGIIGTGGATSGDLNDFEAGVDTSYQGETTLAADAWKTQQGYNYFYYTDLGQWVMPIGAWCAPPTPYGQFTTNQITQDNYNVAAQSGVNALYGLYDRAKAPAYTDALNAIEYAHNAGIVYLVKDSNAYATLKLDGVESIDEVFYTYMSKPGYGGTLFVDEPGFMEFENIGNGTAEWKKHDLFGETKLALVNNLPLYASAAQLYYGAGTQESSCPVDYHTNYEMWLEAYMQMVDPQVFSFDFYPFNGSNTSFTTGYYNQLSMTRRVCLNYNVPYWNFAQVGCWSGGRTFSYAELAFQMHTALAYGCKGLQWFNYWQPLEMAAQYVCGMVDHYGNKTVYYDMCQKINRQIAAVDEYLLKSSSKGIIQIGNSICEDIPASDRVGAYGALSSTSGSSGDAIIGCFEYRDQGYCYYIASNSTTSSATVKLTFNKSYSIKRVQDAAESNTSGSTITVSVPAGEGVLIVVQ